MAVVVVVMMVVAVVVVVEVGIWRQMWAAGSQPGVFCVGGGLDDAVRDGRGAGKGIIGLFECRHGVGSGWLNYNLIWRSRWIWSGS